MNAEYVQAWDITSPSFSGYVYDQSVALDKFSQGGSDAVMEIVTIVRHSDGSREYLPGALASQIKAYREGN